MSALVLSDYIRATPSRTLGALLVAVFTAARAQIRDRGPALRRENLGGHSEFRT